MKLNPDSLPYTARLPASLGAVVMIIACAVAGNGRGATATTSDHSGTLNIEAKAGDCDLHRSKHVVPFAHSAAEPVLCGPKEQHAIAQMEACLDHLPLCRGGHEVAWTREAERCVSLAAPVSDGCLGAFVGPHAPH